MDKRYQVFISSTYEDLIEERQAVMRSLLMLDCIPAGMELFAAADDTAWGVIQKVIDECDYYIVVVGGRYGSTDDDGMGYTEKEYRYAVEKGKLVIGFLPKDPDKIPQGKCEKTDEGKRRLAAFRDLVSQKLCAFYHSPDSLATEIMAGITKLRAAHPDAVGWVRGDATASQELLEENRKYRQRTDELEEALRSVTTRPLPGTEDMAQGDDLVTVEVRGNFAGHTDGATLKCTTTWTSLLAATASELLMYERSEHDMSSLMSHAAAVHQGLRFRDAKSDYTQFSRPSLTLVTSQFTALGLIVARHDEEQGRCWFLTDYGSQVLSRLIAMRKPTVDTDIELSPAPEGGEGE
ncbi:DUF4062 domain-containing protein [bacterium]|nr:DUF4062 domain-containing protein [bacterium]